MFRHRGPPGKCGEARMCHGTEDSPERWEVRLRRRSEAHHGRGGRGLKGVRWLSICLSSARSVSGIYSMRIPSLGLGPMSCDLSVSTAPLESPRVKLNESWDGKCTATLGLSGAAEISEVHWLVGIRRGWVLRLERGALWLL